MTKPALWLLCAILFVAKVGLADDLPDATLVFVENSSVVVRLATSSPTTHVAIVCDGKVYNAEPPVVKVYSPKEYFISLAKEGENTRVAVCRPRFELTDEQRSSLREYLESQVERPYSIVGYIKGKSVEGVHCSGLVAGALKAMGLAHGDTFNVTPHDLRKQTKHIYIEKVYRLQLKNVRRRFSEEIVGVFADCVDSSIWGCVEYLAFFEE